MCRSRLRRRSSSQQWRCRQSHWRRCRQSHSHWCRCHHYCQQWNNGQTTLHKKIIDIRLWVSGNSAGNNSEDVMGHVPPPLELLKDCKIFVFGEQYSWGEERGRFCSWGIIYSPAGVVANKNALLNDVVVVPSMVPWWHFQAIFLIFFKGKYLLASRK
jgi:hypothetical protein